VRKAADLGKQVCAWELTVGSSSKETPTVAKAVTDGYSLEGMLNFSDGPRREVEIMPSLLIHRASELRTETRAALEVELGRSLQDDEEVSIMTFVPHAAPTGADHLEAGRNLQDHFNRIDQKLKGASPEETEEALDEAIRSVRPGYRERE
jgi:hypothetical protein